MTRISSLHMHPQRDGCWLVSFDDDTDLTLSNKTVETYSLTTNQDVDEELFDALQLHASVLPVRTAALMTLQYTRKSSRDLRMKLIQKKFEPKLVDMAIAELQSMGLLDDAVYAESLARSKALSGKQGKMRIQQELRKRGINATQAQDAIEKVYEENDISEVDAVLELAQKKAASYRGIDVATQKRRLFGFLARRGYNAGIISDAMRKITFSTSSSYKSSGASDVDDDDMMDDDE